ncbi:unnamed protein product [Gongylonema pulchrum]|uniref:Aha1_N domain-containing protein n=1 Tax=Gongylonema pulchrum TaxID=637853 RepID=A0A183D0R5_9BILA|nr:unnamed protein product [Gongylonema pulchrum]
MKNVFQVNFSLETTGKHENEIRSLLASDITEFIRKQLAVYIRELKEEFSKGLILPTDRPKPQVVSKGKTTINEPAVNKKAFQDHVVTSKVDTRNLTLSESFKVHPDQLWEVLTDAAMVKKWTNGNVKIDLKPQGAFELYGGMVTGVFDEIEPNKKLVMKWRLKSYPSGHFSNVLFTLKDEKDSTRLEIEAKDVPVLQYDDTENGFQRFYIQNIMKTFGFGARIF